FSLPSARTSKTSESRGGNGMTRMSLAALLLGLCAVSVLGAPPTQDGGGPKKKEAWEWTDEERIAARFDPAYVKANTRSGAERYGYPAAENVPGHAVLVVDGSKNPEIFMPFELFTSLTQGLDDDQPSYRDGIRSMYHDRLVAFGYKDPEVFWR